MRIKVRPALLSLAGALLLTLLALALLAGQAGYRGLLLAAPSGSSTRGQSVERIEELIEDEKLLLTYEIPQHAVVEALHSKHTVTLIGTNSAYPEVMGYLPLDGGFFPKSAWDAKSRLAVLNENAAFAIFGGVHISGGTLRMNGELWIVAGVIRDASEDALIIYVPSSVTGGSAQSLMALTDQNGRGDIYAVSALGELGVYDTSYDFISLSRLSAAFLERFWAACMIALCAAVLLLEKHGGAWLGRRFSLCREKLKDQYLREFLAQNRPELARLGGGALLLLAGIAALLFCSLRVAELFLSWGDLSLPARHIAGDFADRLQCFYTYLPIGIGVFIAFLAAAAALLILFWKPSSSHSS